MPNYNAPSQLTGNH